MQSIIRIVLLTIFLLPPGLKYTGKLFYLLFGAWWPGGRMSDSKSRDPGFQTHRCLIMSLSKTHKPSILGVYQGRDFSIPNMT